MRRRLVSSIALVLAFVVAMPSGPAGAAPCLVPPVVGLVADPFRAPECPYCAGNRGIEYATTVGTAVVASAAGTVSFAGSVAGIRYLVIEHADGFRTTYGRLDRIDVRVGHPVVTGERVGLSSAGVFFGLRSGPEYLDPQPHLATLLPRPQLVPLDGSAPRPGRPPRWRCP